MEALDALPYIFAAFAIFEALQVYIMLRAVRDIRIRVFDLLPEGSKAGDIVAQGALAFMKRVKEHPEDAEAMIGFASICAAAGWETVKERIPLLGGKEGGGAPLAIAEKALSKNPWASLAFGIIQAAMPQIQQKIAEAPKGGSGGGNKKW